jgi:tRNA(adenine34) deaminase
VKELEHSSFISVATRHDHWMAQALMLAQQAGQQEEVPVGALLVTRDKLLASAGNASRQQCDPTAHAEMLVLRQAARQSKHNYLHDTTLYVTLEPCLMCLGAIIHLQVSRVVFGAYDPARGAAGSSLDILQFPGIQWRPDMIGGVSSEQSCELLRSFFQQQRRRIATSS